MRDALERVTLGLAGGVFTLVGVFGLIDPRFILDPLQIHLESGAAFSEGRAMYGAGHITLGLLIFVGTFVPSMRVTSLWANVALCGGLTLGRIVSFGMEGWPTNTTIHLFLLSEPFGAMFSALWLWLRRDATAPQQAHHP